MSNNFLFPSEILDQAQKLLGLAHRQGLMIRTAESCTGGLIASALTAIPGSSEIFDRGFVTYTNAAKTEMLQVAAALLEEFGAVSAEVAEAMALGATASTQGKRIGISVTGIAGPGGGSDNKPVGLVWFGVSLPGRKVFSTHRIFSDMTRDEVRMATVSYALTLLIEQLS